MPLGEQYKGVTWLVRADERTAAARPGSRPRTLAARLSPRDCLRPGDRVYNDPEQGKRPHDYRAGGQVKDYRYAQPQRVPQGTQRITDRQPLPLQVTGGERRDDQAGKNQIETHERQKQSPCRRTADRSRPGRCAGAGRTRCPGSRRRWLRQRGGGRRYPQDLPDQQIAQVFVRMDVSASRITLAVAARMKATPMIGSCARIFSGPGEQERARPARRPTRRPARPSLPTRNPAGG